MRVAVYARVSTEHEAQINALENQLEWYKIECSRHSDWEIVEVYVDQGITGTQAQKRPEFLRMMEDTENVLLRVQDARETLQLADNYMGELGKGIYDLTNIKLSDRKVQEFINEFFPVTEDLTDGQRKNNLRLQEDLKARYYNAPDLEWVGKNGWRFVNAVSDFATHADPIRKTRNYNENLFLRTAEGNPMIDKAYKMVLAAA